MRIGTGAGFSSDRLDPAVELAAHGGSTTWYSNVSGSAHWRLAIGIVCRTNVAVSIRY